MRKLFFLFTFLITATGYSQKFIVTPAGLADNGVAGKNYIEFNAPGKQADALFNIYFEYYKTKKTSDVYIKDFKFGESLTYEIKGDDVMHFNGGMGIVLIYDLIYTMRLDFYNEKVLVTLLSTDLMPDDPKVPAKAFPFTAFFNKKGEVKKEKEKAEVEVYLEGYFLKLQDLAK
jgi:hypothetical protein